MVGGRCVASLLLLWQCAWHQDCFAAGLYLLATSLYLCLVLLNRQYGEAATACTRHSTFTCAQLSSALTHAHPHACTHACPHNLLAAPCSLCSVVEQSDQGQRFRRGLVQMLQAFTGGDSRNAVHAFLQLLTDGRIDFAPTCGNLVVNIPGDGGSESGLAGVAAVVHSLPYISGWGGNQAVLAIAASSIGEWRSSFVDTLRTAFIKPYTPPPQPQGPREHPHH
jgi:hypothetical protein